MKVILKQDVEKLGDAGDIVDVADGYGNNYLMPRGLAMRATKGAVTDAAAIRSGRAKREARNLEEAREQQARLEARPVSITAKAGEDGTLYGSVGNREIAEAIAAQLGVSVDRRRVPMERPLKSLGEHEVTVRLHPELTATVRVDVAAAQ
ncbi:MAG TPA: 50S ribosomal protein L9 [Egibacteraceae bacterium]|nr:50S ribosomal protein L9 [Egibacteraceae bacterium]